MQQAFTFEGQPETPVQASVREGREAAKRAESAIKPEVHKAYCDALTNLAKQKHYFTGDDFMDEILKLPADLQSKENRGTGGILISFAKRNIIAKTNERAKSRRRHGTEIPVWKSLIFQK